MWSCPYCGNHAGVTFHDQNLKGMLCMHPDCGRFDEMDDVRFQNVSEQQWELTGINI